MKPRSPRVMLLPGAVTLLAAVLAGEAFAAGYSGLIKEAPFHVDTHAVTQENPPGDNVPAYVMAPLCGDAVPGKTSGRALCQVQSVFERNNADLQSIYQIAVNEHPEMKGKLVLHLVIFADGTVTRCEMVSSELKEPATETKLLDRVKAMNFGAIEGKETWEDDYTLVFPSK